MFNLGKDLRDRDVEQVRSVLADRVAGLEESFDGAVTFGLTARNRSHVAYLLARMTDWLDQGLGVGFHAYVDRRTKNSFEVEHIWADHFERHTDEFDNPFTFAEKRNKFGDLLLLPKSFNASYGDKSYEAKLPHYFGQNSLARSLSPTAYEHNPTFLALISRTGLPFKAYPDTFQSADIDERQALYRAICDQVWDAEQLGLGGGTAAGHVRDWYVSFGHGDQRHWDDARAYGFVSAGGGRWYSQTLNGPKPGDRIFAYIAGVGYVGAGTVLDTARPARELVVSPVQGGEPTLLRQLPVKASDMWHDEGHVDLQEYALPISWLATRDIAAAIKEPGLFANQHIACRLRHDPTLGLLIERFGLT
jgi:hypothetical protein